AVAERDQGGMPPIGRRVVKGGYRDSGIADDLARKTSGAPKWPPISRDIFDYRTHWHPRCDLVAPGGQGGRVVNAPRQYWRQSDNRQPGMPCAALRAHDDAVGQLLDLVHRTIEHNPRRHPFGESLGNLLRPTDKAILLSTVFDRDQALQPLSPAQI